MAMDDHQQGELDKGTCLGSGVGEDVSGKTNTQQGELDNGTCLGSGVGEEVSGKTNTQAAFLESNRGRTVVVKLNSDLYYRGVLAGLDMNMNISLVHAEEYVNGQLRQTHGVAVINGKAVLDISVVASEENQNRTESNNILQNTEQPEISNTEQNTEQPESSNTEQPESSSNAQHQQPETDKRTNKEKMRDRRRELENARTGSASRGFIPREKRIFRDPKMQR